MFTWAAWGVLLALTGVLLTYFILLPVALRASMKYSDLLGFSATDWRADEYISFVPMQCRKIFTNLFLNKLTAGRPLPRVGKRDALAAVEAGDGDGEEDVVSFRVADADPGGGVAAGTEQEHLIEALLTLASSEGAPGQHELLDLAAVTSTDLDAARPAISRLGPAPSAASSEVTGVSRERRWGQGAR